MRKTTAILLCVTYLLGIKTAVVQADDWPTYRHDLLRSGATKENLDVKNLRAAWTFQSPHRPLNAWAGPAKWDAYAGIRGLRDMRDYDHAFHATVQGHSLFFGSSVDDSVHCVDLKTGKERWVFRTDGPVRIAPTIFEGRVYFGSDDGFAYCLQATNGKQLWKYCPPETANQSLMIQNARFISKWPCRTGVVVVNRKAYMCFSMLPWKSSWLCAVDAVTGQEKGKGCFHVATKSSTFEASMAYWKKQLVILQGRTSPLVFNAETGRKTRGLGMGGGSFLTVAKDGRTFHGIGNKAGWIARGFLGAVPKGRKSDRLNSYVGIVVTDRVTLQNRDTMVEAIDSKTKKMLWQVPHSRIASTIIAGNHAVIGGRDTVSVLSLKDGSTVWKAAVNGRALGLVVANGRLIVSTSRGTIHCFSVDGRQLVAKNGLPGNPIVKPKGKGAGLSKIVDSGLVGRWAFYGEMNSRAKRRGLEHAERRVGDLVGNQHGLVQGEWRLRRVGGVEAIELDGKTTQVLVTDRLNDAPFPKKQLTIEMWVRPDQHSNGRRVTGLAGVFPKKSKDDHSGWQLGYYKNKFFFGLATTDVLKGIKNATPKTKSAKTLLLYLFAKKTLNVGKWYHLVGTYDGRVKSLYVNGELVSSQKITGRIVSPKEGVYLLGNSAPPEKAQKLAGLIHDVRLFQTAVSKETLKKRYAAEVSRFPAVFDGITGPWAQFISPTDAVIRWKTAKPSPTILQWEANDGLRHIIDRQPTTNHRVLLKGVQAGSIHPYAIAIVENGQKKISSNFELDTHFNFTIPKIDARSKVFADTKQSHKAEQEIRSLLKTTNCQHGMALVMGCETGDRIWQLLRQTKMNVVVVETDLKRAVAVRHRLTKAGVYGSRVTVRHVKSFAKLPYCSCFANLIFLGRQKPWKTSDAQFAAEVSRVLRPNGGVAILTLPFTGGKTSLYWKRLLKTQIIDRQLTITSQHSQTVIVRGKLLGAGEWSHLYGRPDNSAFGGETLNGARSSNDLQVQWMGRPGPRAQADRSGRKPSPLSKNGRLFMQGLHRIICIDAYNGVILWALEIPQLERFNMPRDSSNWCVDDDYVYAAIRGDCWQIDARTGELVRRHRRIAGSKKDWRYDWSYLARSENLLVGSSVKQGSAWTNFWGKYHWYDSARGAVTHKVCSENLFAFDRKTGKKAWAYSQGVVINPTITIGYGMVYFVECRDPKVLNSALRRIGLSELWSQQYLVALDLKTGKKMWEQQLKIAKGDTAFWLASGKDRLVIVSSANKKFNIYTYNRKTGKPSWKKSLSWPGGKSDHGKALSRPAIIGDRLIVRPYVLSLKTGTVMKYQVPSGKCGTYAATTNLIIFRSKSVTMWDPEKGQRSTWSRLRPGCWLSTIPANGMLLSPEGGGGCSCGQWLETSIGFAAKNRK